MPSSRVLALIALAALAGCRPLVHEPWSLYPEDTAAAGVMVGWNFTEGDLSVVGDGTSGGPIESDESSLSYETDTVFDLGIEGDYYLTENWVFGARIEWRSNEPKAFDLPFQNISYDFRGEEYVTQHFALGLRYLFDPQGPSRRFRSFLGAEVSYVPELKTGFDVTSSLEQQERVEFEGAGRYAVGARGGMAILLTDDTTLELGALWEWSLGGHEDIVVFGDRADPSRTNFEIEPDTFVLFFTLKSAL